MAEIIVKCAAVYLLYKFLKLALMVAEAHLKNYLHRKHNG